MDGLLHKLNWNCVCKVRIWNKIGSQKLCILPFKKLLFEDVSLSFPCHLRILYSHALTSQHFVRNSQEISSWRPLTKDDNYKKLQLFVEPLLSYTLLFPFRTDHSEIYLWTEWDGADLPTIESWWLQDVSNIFFRQGSCLVLFVRG